MRILLVVAFVIPSVNYTSVSLAYHLFEIEPLIVMKSSANERNVYSNRRFQMYIMVKMTK